MDNCIDEATPLLSVLLCFSCVLMNDDDDKALGCCSAHVCCCALKETHESGQAEERKGKEEDIDSGIRKGKLAAFVVEDNPCVRGR